MKAKKVLRQNWWGKVLGATVGLVLGGPMGALLGAALGHSFDRGVGGFSLAGLTGRVEKVQSTFFTATFSVMGHVAKADGRVTQREISMAEQVMQQMKLAPEQRKMAVKLFQQGKAPDFPLNDILTQFRTVARGSRNLVLMFMEILTATALADGKLHAAEDRVLNHVARQMGFTPTEYQNILSRMQAQAQFRHSSPGGGSHALDDAYKLLGVKRGSSDEEVKKAYRRQMNQNHPDKLVAKGMPKEMIDMATRKSSEIRSAYDLIRESRSTPRR